MSLTVRRWRQSPARHFHCRAWVSLRPAARDLISQTECSAQYPLPLQSHDRGLSAPCERFCADTIRSKHVRIATAQVGTTGSQIPVAPLFNDLTNGVNGVSPVTRIPQVLRPPPHKDGARPQPCLLPLRRSRVPSVIPPELCEI